MMKNQNIFNIFVFAMLSFSFAACPIQEHAAPVFLESFVQSTGKNCQQAISLFEHDKTALTARVGNVTLRRQNKRIGLSNKALFCCAAAGSFFAFLSVLNKE